MRAISRGLLVLGAIGLILVLLPEYFPDHGVVYRAIVEGDDARVRAVLARGGDPNSRSAVLSEVCWFLLRPRNSSNVLPDFGEQPPLLSIAINQQQLAIARTLLDAGADPNARDERGVTPLAYAVITDDPGLVRALLARGADAGLTMPDGSTALREGPELGFRVRSTHPEIVRMLETGI